jgi:hypothetical protein
MKMIVFCDVAPCSLVEMTDVLKVRTASIIRAIALMMEAVRTSETSVNFYQTARRNIPQGSYLHTRRRDNRKSHKIFENL